MVRQAQCCSASGLRVVLGRCRIVFLPAVGGFCSVDLRVCVWGESCLREGVSDFVVDTLLNGRLGWKGLL